MNTTLHRRRRKHIDATIFVDATLAPIATHNESEFAQSFLERSRIPTKGRARRKRKEEAAEESEEFQKAVEAENALQEELKQFTNENNFAFVVEKAYTYEHELEEEKRRVDEEIAAKKAAEKEARRKARHEKRRAEKKARKEPEYNRTEDWVAATTLVTTGQGTSFASSVPPTEKSNSSFASSILATEKSFTPLRDEDLERMPRVSVSRNAGSALNCFYLEDYVGSSDSLGELLHVCGQEAVLPFEDIDVKWEVRAKLGEGVYGEVYLARWDGKQDIAVKVIPFHGDDNSSSTVKFNGELLKSPRSMLPEIVMTRELSSLREGTTDRTDGFVELQNAFVVQGEYPQQLTKNWQQYAKQRGSENDPPSTYSAPQQLYLLLCLGVAGHDLENFPVKSDKEAASIFTQVAFSLMVAEHAMEFEHRDLHVGNVLVSRENVPDVISYSFEGCEYRFATHGVKATIIDFTNSRMRKEATVICVDLEMDPDLFDGAGDYQFDIYRMMREHNKGNWRTFEQRSNLMWMHYIATKVFDGGKNTKLKRQLKKFVKATANMLQYNAISEYIISDEFVPIFGLVDEN
ncbi:hypothetical protein L596_025408 [Steinernema carpocapsae]|uniref:non-specific serine/threonine protein kinase n=1 Tax=Steinernema carpocapsae TaxID=34508 RepID=A0A4U5M7P8_STECR|nr:hypothetical protein L596_025408 [Steinernema carpocapsae]